MYKYELFICDNENMYIDMQFFKSQASSSCSKKWFTSTGLDMVYQYFSLALPWLVIQSLFSGTQKLCMVFHIITNYSTAVILALEHSFKP
jgi:hypothetical protein